MSTGVVPTFVNSMNSPPEPLYMYSVMRICATAGVTTIEYEPGLLQDLPALCEKLAPRGVTYHHDATWHDGNGYAHLLAALFKPSLSIPMTDGEPILGTWQQVILADFDNRPRQRKLVIQVMGESD